MTAVRKAARPLLDPVKAWDAMSSQAQRAIGVAALVLLIADYEPHGDESWNWEAARVTGAAALNGSYMNLEMIGAEPPRVDLGALGVRMCHGCGCTDDCACEDGCSWIGPNRCSRCGPRRRRRRA